MFLDELNDTSETPDLLGKVNNLTKNGENRQ